MKKIITCGLRYSDFARQRDLFALRNNKDVEIVGEILFEANDEEIFFCRKTVEEALDNSFDFIMLCGMEKETVLAAIKSCDR
ncbi:MAG: hypothetical protein K5675_07100, partial [Lachnospiraceae bacterium]|nr:hypothetical protein [Lachnospiraceae bacterium]